MKPSAIQPCFNLFLLCCDWPLSGRFPKLKFNLVFCVFAKFNDGNKHRQTSFPVVRHQTQTDRNFETSSSNCGGFLGFVNCWRIVIVLQVFPNFSMVWPPYSHRTLFGNLDFFLRKNLSNTASASNSNTAPSSSRPTRKPSNFPSEHGKIQKGSVHRHVDPVDIGSLLYSASHRNSFSHSKRFNFTCLHCFAIRTDFNFSELIIKPFLLLLEDCRSQASSKEQSQANLLFILLISIYWKCSFIFQRFPLKLALIFE